MHLIVGLGNPGPEFENTRHNAGFMVLDLLAGGQDWEPKHDALLLKTQDVILAKPQKFMNLSGESVSQVLKYHPAAELVVVHDELDLPLGSMRIQRNASAAGHNGVQSVMDAVGTKDFIRIRIGVGNPETRGEMPGDAFVLQKFTPKELEVIKETLVSARTAVETLLTEGLEAAQSKYNG